MLLCRQISRDHADPHPKMAKVEIQKRTAKSGKTGKATDPQLSHFPCKWADCDDLLPRLKIVVSPVRVRVSPSIDQSPAKHSFIRSLDGLGVDRTNHAMGEIDVGAVQRAQLAGAKAARVRVAMIARRSGTGRESGLCAQ
jgi:hypothetical protein